MFIASVGTGRTLFGIAQTLKRYNPSITVVGIELTAAKMLTGKPKDLPLIEGITDGIIPKKLKSELADRVFVVSDEDAIKMPTAWPNKKVCSAGSLRDERIGQPEAGRRV